MTDDPKASALEALLTEATRLTETELRRLAGLARAMRRERVRGPRASDWTAEALPAVEVAHAVASVQGGLILASLTLYAFRRQLPLSAETAANVRTAEAAVDALLRVVMERGLEPDDLAALAMLLRAHSDGEAPALVPRNTHGAYPGWAAPWGGAGNHPCACRPAPKRARTKCPTET